MIGAGLGGLTAAACLAGAGVETLVLERTASPGGRCYARSVEGHEYDIGAVYLGERVPGLLRDEFGLDCPYKPFLLGVRMGKALVPFPFSLRTCGELLRTGEVSPAELGSFLWSIRNLFRRPFFLRQRSVRDALDALTGNSALRRLGYVLSGVSGTSPDRLPSHYLEMGRGVSGTVTGNPVHLAGGNRRVADLLAGAIRDRGGDIVYGATVDRILPGGDAVRVLTGIGEFRCDYLVSNAGVRSTVLDLCPADTWSPEYLAEIGGLKTSLQVVNAFLTISGRQAFPPGFGIFFSAADPIAEFSLLEKGVFPERSMYLLQVPTNLADAPVERHHATLQFYSPRGGASRAAIGNQARRIMEEGLEDLFPGLAGNVLNCAVYDPARYEKEFGFKPHVFGISPDMANRRPHVRTPHPRVWCVGDSVCPDRPSAPQAMESGLLAAKDILRRAGASHAG